MASAPKISVIIPVYNVEQYLRPCLDSVAGQTLSDIEIVCVDDGSTDGSGDILEEYRRRDGRFVVVRQPNRGVSCARNVGLERAEGEYVVFVDADDYVERAMLHTLWAEIDRSGADIVVFGGVSFPAAEWVDQSLSPRRAQYHGQSIQALLHEAGSRPCICNKAYRRTLLVENGVSFAPHLSLGEDQAFQFLAFPRAERVSFIPDKLYHYRQSRPGSAMERLAGEVDARLAAHIRMVEYVFDSWRASGDMAGHEADWAWWCLDFLYDDAVRAGKAMGRQAVGRVIAWMAQLDVVEALDGASRQRYDALCRLVQPGADSLSPAELELRQVRASLSFRVGRAVTWLPRKLRWALGKVKGALTRNG